MVFFIVLFLKEPGFLKSYAWILVKKKLKISQEAQARALTR